MQHIPGRRADHWWSRRWIVELLSVVPPVTVAAVTGLLTLREPGGARFGWVLVAAALWLAISSAVRVLHARSRDAERADRADHVGLNGALHVLYGVVRHAAGLGDGADDHLRATIHRVVPPSSPGRRPEEMEQLLPYLCRSGGGDGRIFSIRSGIIGRAARERLILTASRRSDDHETMVAELVREWSYPEEEARTLRADRRAWMAVPLVRPGDHRVVAVVYLDSDLGDVFTPRVQEVVSAACGGIAHFLPKAY